MSEEHPVSGFRFAAVTQLDLCAGDFVAIVPPGLATKAELLSAVASELRFPPWFGANWDALADCLSDLSWISAPRVLLVHTDLPLADPEDRAVYIDVLRDALIRGSNDTAQALEVVFPPEVRLPT